MEHAQAKLGGYPEEVLVQPYYETSHKQQGEWIMNVLNQIKRIGSFNLQRLIQAESIHPDALTYALRTLVERHECLRTTFHFVDGTVKQKIHPRVDCQVAYVDLRREASPKAAAKAIINEARYVYIDYATGPLFTAKLLQLADDDFCFVLTINHIISDAWSIDRIKSELLTLYQAYCAGERPMLAEPLQLKAYAAWENNLLRGEEGEYQRSYWHRTLGATPPVHCFAGYFRPGAALPVTSYRAALAAEVEAIGAPALAPYRDYLAGTVPRLITHRGGCYRVVVEERLYRAAEALSRQSGVALFVFLLASFYALLYAVARKPDQVIVVPVALREGMQELESTLGWLVNVLLLRQKADESLPFVQFLRNVGRGFAEAYSHKMYPMEKLLAELDVSFDAIGALHLNYINYGTAEQLPDPGSRHEDGRFYPFCDIDCCVTKYENGLEIVCVYKADLFTRETIENLFDKYLRLLRAVAGYPNATLRELAGA